MPVTSLSDILEGNRLALARTLTDIENGTPQGRDTLNKIFPYTGTSHVVGITGAPGTGKSTLVNRLAYSYRHPRNNMDSRTVAVVAVDPSSPFSGGAVMGDRIRMRDLAGDPGVFIRSMATRGSLGGLARTTAGLVQAFDAAGFDLILVETVGAGQSEVDIARLAHTTVVLEAPGMGDDVQTIKAGILEIADILVVNKFDRPGAKNALRALRNMLNLVDRKKPQRLHHHSPQSSFPEEQPPPAVNSDHGWEIPILTTVATQDKGIEELAARIEKHREFLRESGLWSEKEKQRLKAEMDDLLQEKLISRWRQTTTRDSYHQVLKKLVAREISPQQAVASLVQAQPQQDQDKT